MSAASCNENLPGGIPATAQENGQTLVEYALIIAFIAIFLVLALQLLADGIDTTFTTVVNVLADAVSGLGG
jgi:Flp pilus assembly pilin Flp